MIEWNVAKIVVLLLLAAAVFYLGMGFVGLMRRKSNGSDKADDSLVYRSLVKRVAFSIAALIFIMVAGYSGWFK